MTSIKTGKGPAPRGVSVEPASVARVVIVDDHPVVRQGLAQELTDGGALMRLAIAWTFQNRDLSGERP